MRQSVLAAVLTSAVLVFDQGLDMAGVFNLLPFAITPGMFGDNLNAIEYPYPRE